MSKTPDDLKGEFAVIYEENHAGTFNGVLETLNKSLEDWVNQQLEHYVPGIILDHRTNLQAKLSFLRGQDARFWLKDGSGTPRHDWCSAPPGGIFTLEGARFVQDLKDKRNEHTHAASKYPLLAVFEGIKLVVGSRVLVFNPALTNSSLRVDEGDQPRLRDDGSIMLIRATLPADKIDMEECEHNFTDLFLECLTRKQFEAEYPETMAEGSTHAFVVFYGKGKFFVYFKRSLYELLHNYFGYSSGDRWKTHYFRFRAEAIMDRLVHH